MKRLLLLFMAFVVLIGFSGIGQANTLKVALDADPVSLDPHMQLSGGMLQYSHWVFDPLVRWAKDGGLEPRLATKWERQSPLSVRFYLRKGVKFHSGNEMTAKDVAWTLNRLKVSQDFKGLFEYFGQAKIVDDYTIDLVTKVPYGLVESLATYLFVMDSKFYTGTDEAGKPKDAIVKIGPSFALTNASGTGPFMVTYRQQGVKTVFKRFNGYWDEKTGNVDEMILVPIKENATRVAAILAGDVDLMFPVPPQDLKRVGKDPKLNLITMSGTRVITLQMNQKRRKEFADPKIRAAMVYATNNAGIVQKIMKGFGTTAGQQSPKGYQGYNKDLTPRYDLEKAKALMKEAGYEQGFTATMIAPNNRYVNDAKIAQAFVAMMSKIGIKIELKTMPKAQYWDEYDAQVADIQMVGWHSDTEDTANFFEYLLMCPSKKTGKGQYNSGNYCDPEMDELVSVANSELDMGKRAVMLQKAEKMAYDNFAFIPLHWQNNSWVGKKNQKNLEDVVNVMNFPYLGDLVIE